MPKPSKKEEAFFDSLPDWMDKLEASKGDAVAFNKVISELASAICDAKGISVKEFYRTYLSTQPING